MTWIYDTGGHQLTTQNSLHFVSICHLHLLQKVSCRILCSCVFESPQHATPITQRHRLVISSESKRHQYVFFPKENIYYRTPVSRRHFLPIKDMVSFSISFCVSILFHIEVCLMRKKTSFTELRLLLSCTKNVFVLKINHLWWFSASPLYLLWTAHGLYALSGRQKYRICKIISKYAWLFPLIYI